MNKKYELPESIPEIHLGFLSGNYYIGRTDVGRCCSELNISFNNGEWKIRVKWVCEDGTESVCEKTYNSRVRPLGIFEVGAWEKSPWNTKLDKLQSEVKRTREYLVKLRDENNLTQKDVSLKLGISESYYNLIERGERKKDMSIELLYDLSRIFKIPVKSLIDEELEFTNRRMNI